jgi:hypothetical protein
MAVTAHWLGKHDGHLMLQSALVAFRHIQGSHMGVNIALNLEQIVGELGCLHKISTMTFDNASNNNTCMVALASDLDKLGIPFDTEENRIR